MKRSIKWLVGLAVLWSSVVFSPQARAVITVDANVELISPVAYAQYAVASFFNTVSVTFKTGNHYVALYGGAANGTVNSVDWRLELRYDSTLVAVESATNATLTLNANGNWIRFGSSSGNGGLMASDDVGWGEHTATGYAYISTGAISDDDQDDHIFDVWTSF